MDKKELKECLWEDYTKMIGNRNAYHIIFIKLTQHGSWLRWKYIKNMRKAAFYQERFQSGDKVAGIPMMWHLRRKNIIGNKLGFEIGGDEDYRKRAFYLSQWAGCYTRKVENRELLLTPR